MLKKDFLAHRSAHPPARQLAILLVLVEMLPRSSVTHETAIQ